MVLSIFTLLWICSKLLNAVHNISEKNNFRINARSLCYHYVIILVSGRTNTVAENWSN
jgi:hypothetical protein